MTFNPCPFCAVSCPHTIPWMDHLTKVYKPGSVAILYLRCTPWSSLVWQPALTCSEPLVFPNWPPFQVLIWHIPQCSVFAWHCPDCHSRQGQSLQCYGICLRIVGKLGNHFQIWPDHGAGPIAKSEQGAQSKVFWLLPPSQDIVPFAIQSKSHQFPLCHYLSQSFNVSVPLSAMTHKKCNFTSRIESLLMVKFSAKIIYNSVK